MGRLPNNIIPIIHRLVTDEYGENYWFNGCAGYVMECLGEGDYDYWFFAGLTGDVFVQHYTYGMSTGEALTSYLTDQAYGGEAGQWVASTFAKCGYEAVYIAQEDVQADTAAWLSQLIEHIDRGVPVIAWGHLVGVFVGYEDGGKTLLLITGNSSEPVRVALDVALRSSPGGNGSGDSSGGSGSGGSPDGSGSGGGVAVGSDGCSPGGSSGGSGPVASPALHSSGWIFIGAKTEARPLAEIYREAVFDIPRYMHINTSQYCFGPEAFRAWADDIEAGKFEQMDAADFDVWYHYTNYVCVLATNGSCCHQFIERALDLNPDLDFLAGISGLYRRLAQIWGGDDLANDLDSLEAIGGGFNVTLDILQDPHRRQAIVKKIRQCASVADLVAEAWDTGLKTAKEGHQQ